MSALVRRVRSEYWMIFQVLAVQGPNDAIVEDFMISSEPFEVLLKRYQPLSEEDFKLVVETNNLMKDS
jgi:hypothetical protein